jgi:hypothetical protein
MVMIDDQLLTLWKNLPAAECGSCFGSWTVTSVHRSASVREYEQWRVHI